MIKNFKTITKFSSIKIEIKLLIYQVCSSYVIHIRHKNIKL